MIKHLFILIILIGCTSNKSYSQRITINNTDAYCVNSIKLIQNNKMLLSVKTNPNALAPTNELWLAEKRNDSDLTIISKLSTSDSNKIFWTSHTIFSVKTDTLIVFGATLDTKDTSVSIIALTLDNNLRVIAENETKLNLPFKYPSLQQLFVPFKVHQTANKEFIGTLTIRNSKTDNIYDSQAPISQVVFSFDTLSRLKHISQILSDSLNLGPYFFINHFDLLNLLETNAGNYLLIGEQGLSFILDSAFQVVSFTTTQIWDSKPMQDGQVTYRSSEQGYISASLTLADSSDLSNFPNLGKRIWYNLLRVNELNPNTGMQTKLLIRLPIAHDTARITIIKNGEVFFDNNLSLSNPYLESFSSNSNNDLLFGYHTQSGNSEANYEGEFNLIYLDSNLNLKGNKTFYEKARTELTGVTLAENGDAWVNGYQTIGLTPQGKYNRIPYLRSVTKKELTTRVSEYIKSKHTNFVIYPNPATSSLNRNAFPKFGIARFLNTTGAMVKQLDLMEQMDDEIRIDDIPTGFYFVEIVQQNMVTTRAKLLIVK